MGLFKQIVEPLIAKNIPVIPLRPKTKIAFISNWPEIASTNPEKITQWDEEYPEANAACVAFAKPGGVCILEIDKPGFVDVIERDTGQKIPETLTVRSSPGKGHLYFRHTPASIALGNKQGKDETGRESWSLRGDNRYCVAPLSHHPTSGRRYELLRDTEPAPAPDWLIEWCAKSGAVQVATGHTEFDDTTPISEGGRNNALTSILGRARQVLKMDRAQLEQFGLSVNQKRCNPPLSEAEVKVIAGSVASYPITQANPINLGGKILGVDTQTSAPAPAPLEREPTKEIPYPVFPRWVMKGTSLYDGFVGPICQNSSRIPEFMFLPGVALMLNYIGTKVRIEYKNTSPSFYLCLIGEKGRGHKSSSVNDVMGYLRTSGILGYHTSQTRNSEGKTTVYTSGSTEGLGLEMQRTNCKNGVLYYDELSLLVNKAGIQNSSMLSHLLTAHESGQWGNQTKARREVFTFEPGTYCVSLICCTTPKGFEQHWSKMGGESSGMDDRFFFIMQPQVLPGIKLQTTVDTSLAAVETRKRLDKAIKQQVYSIDDTTRLENEIEKLGVRSESRVEKMALYFAIDMNRDSIDEECIERALAICKYEEQTKQYLRLFESSTREGAVQNRIIQALQRNSGAMTRRKLERSVNPLYYGTSLFGQCMRSLEGAGYIIKQGTGTKGDPEMIILMRNTESEE